MITELQKIAPLVSRQFPAFYQEEGENFIQFIKAYYEWMDDQAGKGPLYKVRNLLETNDIDEAAEAYLEHFLTKYMRGIPRSVLSNKRLLQKHILDVYRAKGSIEGLKLLFKLLYNVEAQIYLPQENMLIASGGVWVSNKYFEVEDRDSNYSYNNKTVTGTTSGATAYVTNAAKIYLGTQVAHIFYLNDIKDGPTGQPFQIGEYLVYDGLDISEATLIKGSAISATAVDSTENHALSDILSTANATGEGLKFSVSTIKDPERSKGYITFKIINGGYGYALDSNISIANGTSTTGTGASFKIGRIANALTNNTVVIGTISELTAVTSGDHNYNGDLSIRVYESRVTGYGYKDSSGNIWGNNAVITGTLSTGNGVVDTVRLYNSGFGYNTQGEELEFTNNSNGQCIATLSINIGAVGTEEGNWLDTRGFLNSDMYLTDSYYYQNFSYEVQIEKSLDKYIDILKQVMHPVGNEVFGRPVIIDSTVLNPSIKTETVTAT